VGPRAGLDGCGKFAPTGIPARSGSLYQLPYSGLNNNNNNMNHNKHESLFLIKYKYFLKIKSSNYWKSFSFLKT
jgi:hypothetical protein